MNRILVVVDMQNDFIDGALGTKEAVAIVDRVKGIVDSFEGKIIFTRDTHTEKYLETSEGRNLPVIHCVKNTIGWQISKELDTSRAFLIIDKPVFGSLELAQILANEDNKEKIDEVLLVGLCTDICVISNAMIAKSTLYEAKITVDASACAGVTPESHERALEAMKMCQINVING